MAGPRKRSYGAIVLDILLPGMNGYKVCETLRQEGIWTPILMLTAKRGVYDEAEALDTGADDFLSKPFVLVVLVARLRALLRRGATPRRCEFVAGDLAMDPVARTCAGGEVPIDLTRREYALLEALLRHADEGATKAQLLSEVWRRLHGRRQRGRGVRRLPAPQDRRAVRAAFAPDGAGHRRLPDGRPWLAPLAPPHGPSGAAGSIRCGRCGSASRWRRCW